MPPSTVLVPLPSWQAAKTSGVVINMRAKITELSDKIRNLLAAAMTALRILTMAIDLFIL